MFNPLRGRGRDRLSEIIQNPIRKVENPERARTRERFSEPTTSPSLSPHSEMKRKRDACNQADVDTEFRRGVPPLLLPPPLDTGARLEGFKYDAEGADFQSISNPSGNHQSAPPRRLLSRRSRF